MPTTDVPTRESWNLSDLFADDDAFETARQEAQRLLPSVDGYRGRLLDSATSLADALDALCEINRRLLLLHCYASLKSDEDTRKSAYQAMRKGVEVLSTEMSQRCAFVRPEILAAEPETVEGYLNAELRLAPHAHFLRDLLRRREHVLGPAEERIVAEAGLLTREPGSLYSILTNAEMPRPEVTLSTGETVRLTAVNFQKHRTTTHRPDRLAIFPRYFEGYAAFRETLAQNLYAGVKAHLFRARVRGYPSCLAASLDGDNVPVSVYHNLIRQVRERLGVMHRYFRLRAEKLGLERLEYPDLSCPLTTALPKRYTVEETERLVGEALEPLGEEYGSELASAFGSRWIDWHPGPGKRSGAYATGWAYDFHPYVMMNFTGELQSVLTLAHEMGHAMHSFFSNRFQPFATADYSIFVAEVASTFNEALVIERMAGTAETAEERLSLLGGYLDGIRGTLFRQVMFAEFELAIHERVERGEVLTGDSLDEIYLRLLRLYHGHDQGVVHVGEEYAVEWAAIPHMYYDFYVYQYATGIIAAGALAREVADGVDGAQERYLGFLRAGGSGDPLELLRRAGVDLESSEPYGLAFAAVSSGLDRLEEELGRTADPSLT